MFGKSDDDFFSREAAAAIHALDREVLAGGATLEVEEVVHTPTLGPRSFRTRKMPLFNAKGEPEFLAGMSTDITEPKQAEEALRRSEADLRAVQERLIQTIRELSTPVLPIHDGVLVVPLVGHMDIERAGQLMEALLGRIHRHATHTVILDVTGLPAVDAAVTGHLIQAVRAAGLLGARCVVVGISPAVAAALVELGVDLGALVTRSDLQAGVAFAVACGGPSLPACSSRRGPRRLDQEAWGVRRPGRRRGDSPLARGSQSGYPQLSDDEAHDV